MDGFNELNNPQQTHTINPRDLLKGPQETQTPKEIREALINKIRNHG